MVHEMVAAAREMADLLARLQRIVRFKETEAAGAAMLDLDAAVRDERSSQGG